MSIFSTAWSVSVTRSVDEDFVITTLAGVSNASRTSWKSRKVNSKLKSQEKLYLGKFTQFEGEKWVEKKRGWSFQIGDHHHQIGEIFKKPQFLHAKFYPSRSLHQAKCNVEEFLLIRMQKSSHFSYLCPEKSPI